MAASDSRWDSVCAEQVHVVGCAMPCRSRRRCVCSACNAIAPHMFRLQSSRVKNLRQRLEVTLQGCGPPGMVHQSALDMSTSDRARSRPRSRPVDQHVSGQTDRRLLQLSELPGLLFVTLLFNPQILRPSSGLCFHAT